MLTKKLDIAEGTLEDRTLALRAAQVRRRPTSATATSATARRGLRSPGRAGVSISSHHVRSRTSSRRVGLLTTFAMAFFHDDICKNLFEILGWNHSPFY